MTNLVWEEPRITSRPPSRVEEVMTPEVQEALKSRPGKWARIIDVASTSRKVTLQADFPDFDFANSRNPEIHEKSTQTSVYARYVGHTLTPEDLIARRERFEKQRASRRGRSRKRSTAPESAPFTPEDDPDVFTSDERAPRPASTAAAAPVAAAATVAPSTAAGVQDDPEADDSGDDEPWDDEAQPVIPGLEDVTGDDEGDDDGDDEDEDDDAGEELPF